ncbi:pepsin-like aspartic protease [Alteromonas gracilis]|uniref:pepsin-like aspartic protease n=1 Tax=Alteromonas gracilis TaxID=1479524 RepID=UPI003734EC37
MTQSLRLPITNTFADGGYSVKAHVGAHQQSVHLILDTGSSTLVLGNAHYHVERDSDVVFTYYSQAIKYAEGSWYGPVIKTTVRLGILGHSISLPQTYVAIAKEPQKLQEPCFKKADGIMGLAYQPLNHAYRCTDKITDEMSEQAFFDKELTEPSDTAIANLKTSDYVATTLPSYFSELEQRQINADKFAFWLHRSSVYNVDGNCLRAALAHRKNHGLFVIGEPIFHRDLYAPPIMSVKVLHDKYYNVTLKAIRCEGAAAITAPTLAPSDKARWCSNAIVDSGATVIGLPESLYNEVIEQIYRSVENAKTLLAPFAAFSLEEQGTALDKLDLATWPELTFVLEGDNGEDVSLSLPPEAYWQVHAPTFNQASFKIFPLKHWPNQSILGLPLISQFYTIFDRGQGANGVVSFARKVTVSNTVDALKHVFEKNS